MAHRFSNNILRLRPTSKLAINQTNQSSTSPVSLSSKRLYASASSSASSSDKKSNVQGLGEVGKGDKNARPVILEHAAPANPKDPEVRRHNEEFEKRPDRAVNDDKESNKTKENETGKKA